MLCPFCAYVESKVVNSRQSPKGDTIRRRRECLKCGHRFTTFEMVEKTPVTVIKRDGTHEPFDRRKVETGILRACQKRPVGADEVERVVAGVERAVQNAMEKEMGSQKIGEMVLRALRAVDEVAYIRFASVYRQFRDVSEFTHELRSLNEASVSKVP